MGRREGEGEERMGVVEMKKRRDFCDKNEKENYQSFCGHFFPAKNFSPLVGFGGSHLYSWHSRG